ncbi:hypothetical protein SpCBS45565_g06207 [Spizellomyces sp. 'palustris']|nr:hypothetical protein SpCBS45565_g06207 [Spizellomyces sp. 'palustris']
MLELPTHPYHTLPFLPLEPATSTDALVDEYTHHYSDSMFTAIVIPAGPLKSSNLPNPCLFPPNTTAAVVEEAAEDIDIDPSDVIDRSDSFELNPLQEALQAGLGENLLSGLAADAEANLTAESNGVDDTITSGRIFGDLSDPVLFSPSPEPPESVPCKREHLEILDCDSDLDDLTDGSAVIAGREDDDIESISDGVLEVDVEDEMIDIDGDDEPVKDCVVRQSHRPTVYEEFTQKGIDWCRYCGVTKAGQTAAFRPGPWGRRTLCNKHGCDYKGYGYADKQSRLDLTQFRGESGLPRTAQFLFNVMAVLERTTLNAMERFPIQCGQIVAKQHGTAGKPGLLAAANVPLRRQFQRVNPVHLRFRRLSIAPPQSLNVEIAV